MRFTDDKKIRKSIIRLFTYTEQIILLKSFTLIQNETRDNFTNWLKGIAYEFIDSVKNVTILPIIMATFYFFDPPKSQIYNYIANYAVLIYLAFSLLAILNKARIIGCGYVIGLKLFLFCISNRIFFEPKSENKAYPPLNTQSIKVYIDNDAKKRKLITKTFTFKEQLTLLRLFSIQRKETNGDFWGWLKKEADASFSSIKVVLIIIFTMFIFILIKQPDAWNYILILFFIMISIMTLVCIFSLSHFMGCKLTTSIKLLYFHIKSKGTELDKK
ncbi:hypothetical protein [Xenorhabdus hominickii]|uniref:Uncharacterized protein n=1 Tax=Xenorhabdus hominickii TaxID=351679 RepID=A0A2G0Q7X1_XENHO|nr:hypothetical protein [Xenorhabdus hominickii]AOM41406.1 hypothetical protein A9255_12920 [Xenorhabdus hominickii]PHM55317.1 hypothetical protein Xhom_02051 [Xenorhabdus hominickii]PHM57318.1 hypothetical protein Xhom_00284 [Xenorhabdus hominickii]